MPDIMLLGDSIRQIGYGTRIPNVLGTDFTVWQSGDNERFAKYTLCQLQHYLTHMPHPDAVHWNNGLWDTAVYYAQDGVFTPLDEYIRDMKRIAQVLLNASPHVIFVKTTHLAPAYGAGKNGLNANRNRYVDEYNASVVPELEQMGVTVHDLNPLLDGHPERYRPDNVHLSEEGIEVCAAQVADKIRACLNK